MRAPTIAIRIFTLSAALTICLTLAACSRDDEPPVKDAQEARRLIMEEAQKIQGRNPDVQSSLKAALKLNFKRDGRAGDADQPTIEELLVQLENADMINAIIAAQQLGNRQEEAVGSIPAILELLTHANNIKRRKAAMALERMDGVMLDFAPSLFKLAADPDPGRRRSAVGVLSKSKLEPADLAPAFTDALLEMNSEERQWLLSDYTRAGEVLAHSTGTLEDMIEDSDPRMRALACDALGVVPVENGLARATQIAKLINDAEAEVRAACVRGLGAMGGEAAPHIDEIVALQKDESAAVRAAVVVSTARIADDATPYLPMIGELLEDEDATVRRAALQAADLMGKEAAPILSQIIARLGDSEPSIRKAVPALIKKTMPLSIEYGAEIAKWLKDPDPSIRQAAAASFAPMGVSGQHHSTYLWALLTDREKGVRKAAARTLERMGKKVLMHVNDPYIHVRRGR